MVPLLGQVTSVAVRALADRLAAKLPAGVAVDFALRKFDEARNREGLKQALTALVDEEKVKSELSSAVDSVKGTALGDFIPSQLR